MSVIKTGIEVDTNSSFSNPTSFEENGALSSISATGLTAETGYYVRAYVVDELGNIYYSENTETFTTAAIIPVNEDYFYIESIYTPQSYSDSNQITIHKQGSPSTGSTLEYSTDKSNWDSVNFNSAGNRFFYLLLNQKVYFRSSDGFSQDISNYYKFSSTQNITTGGDLRTLLDYTDVNLDTASSRCFYNLFDGAATLQNITNLDFSKITNLANYCYASMFSSCTSISAHPALPATSLAEGCYSAMFNYCIRLTTASNLPATTLANLCYLKMYYNCNLTETPVLPATTLANYCYSEMFRNCDYLNKVTTYAQDISATNCLDNWLSGVAVTGDFYNLGGATYPSSSSGIPTGWTEHNNFADFFYIQNQYNGSNTITLNKLGTPTTGTSLEYSTDNLNWNSCVYDSNNQCHITLSSQNKKVFFRSADGFSSSTSNYYKFSSTQNFIIGGDLTTLLDYTDNNIDTIPNHSAFYGMFQNSTTITDASLLDCSKIVHSSGNSDFISMFDGCSNLLYACDFPNLTDATYNIFGECFRNCTNLVRGSQISNITSASSWGLQNMYQNCYNIKEVWAPNLSSWPGGSTGFMNNAGQNVTSGGLKVIYVPTGAVLPPYPSQSYPWNYLYI